jgi:ABC-type dipeptide/oligopeptide/nickel transport system permease component
MLPAMAISFIVSVAVGAVFGFYHGSEIENIGAAKSAVYFVNSLISIFVFGYLAKLVIANQLKIEGKEFLISENNET